MVRDEDDEEALQRRFQGEGVAGSDPWRADADGAGRKAWRSPHDDCVVEAAAIAGMAGTFSGGGEASRAASDAEVDKLHAKIGQLLVERDF